MAALRTHIVIADPDHDLVEQIRNALSTRDDISLTAATENLQSVGKYFEEKEPSILLVGPGWNGESTMSFIEEFTIKYPYAPVLVLIETLSTEVLQKALRSGAKDVLQLPLTIDSFFTAIDAAARFSASVLDVSLTMPKEISTPKLGQMVTVCSTKGGVGKTVIATNLAAYLAMQGKDVYIVDLDLQYGDVAVMFKLTPKRSIHDAVLAGDRLDQEMLESLVATHKESRTKALLAPVEPDLAELINEKQVAGVLSFLKANADYVIVDTAASIDKIVVEAVDMSDRIFLVAAMDLPSIKSAKIAYGMLQILNVPKERISLLLNRADSKVGLTAAQAEKTIGTKVFATIPSDRLVPRSVNMGSPVVVSSTRTDVGRAFERLGQIVLGGVPRVTIETRG